MTDQMEVLSTSGVEGTKKIVNGVFIKETRIRSPREAQERVDKLRSAGIPLPDMVKFSENGMEATDMTEGRKKVIIDTHTHQPVELKNPDDVKDQIGKIGLTAFNAGIRLTMDSFAVVVDKATNIGKAYVLDVTSLRPTDPQDSIAQVQLSIDAFNDIVESKIKK